MTKIRSSHPSITNTEIKYVNKAIIDGWGSNMNLYIDEFKRFFSKFVKKKYVLPVSHCTDAILLSLMSIGIKKGDEVIVPDLTWVASASPILHLGAKIKFVDVSKDTLCIDEKGIEKNITKKTKAIISVDLLGNMPNYDKIIKICKKYKLFLIEDAAESIGAKFKNKNAGYFGDISVFSFNATKLVMSGQGGCLCTNNKNLYEKAKLFSHHGIDQKKTGKYYWSTVLGYNFNWTNIQAALALAQMKRINYLLNYKSQIYKLYKKYFKNIPNVDLTKNINGVNQTYWIVYAIIKKKINKEKFCKKFKKYNIDMRPIFYRLSSMPTFSNTKLNRYYQKKNYNSESISKSGVCLPNGYDLNEKKIKLIAKVFNKILNG